MFWVDRIADDIEKEYADAAPVIIRDEKTISGRVHIGSLRGVAIHGLIAEVLGERGVPVEYLYEINDFDVMDGLPSYLDEETYRPYMGRLLKDVPAPDGSEQSYADYFAAEFKAAIEKAGFAPKYYTGTELYTSGKMDPYIRLALENADKIRGIYKKVSGSTKPDDWLPLNVVCENCGKVGTTKATSFDGEQVSYVCQEHGVEWATGCGHEGSVSPFGGNAKLPWKPEWAAKWGALGVQVEGAGKDHSTRGGARDVANHIAREVFDIAIPYDVPYEFFLVGGKKMSSSKGSGSTAHEVSELFPTEVFRLALLGKDINQQINFEPEGETVPVLYDQYDRLADLYEEGVADDFTRLYSLVHIGAAREHPPKRYRPRFSQVAYMLQMPHVNMHHETEEAKGAPLEGADVEVLEERGMYARHWLTTYAPERYKFDIQESLPAQAKDLTDIQKDALRKLHAYVTSVAALEGQELHTQLHAIKEESGIAPKDFFQAIYLIFLGKESGPKAGWFLSVMDKDFVEQRLAEAIA